ncbi:hypothetical protein BVER_05880 [Candidatus Burkholderia verschuerenii]|uniref:Lipoprotein n=1 Tax=Candidatus Burkholderia verschuerenii TaxID=242163 RepID=A0A0L0MGH7_9BURK|nr:protein YgfX [Candidatus Burkholderia verschuerenii]KND61787.1 hypothetical protein BVER_05880 [Candidatus Burkholderia verschuerenii]
MASASVERPHRSEGIAMRPSRFLRGALVAFVGIAGAAVFECVRGYAGGFDACVAAIACVAALGLGALRWMRRLPVAIDVHADTFTTWDRGGDARHWRIAGCAQWGGWLLALTLRAETGRTRTLLIAADSIDSDTFRQIAVSARRAARAYL